MASNPIVPDARVTLPRAEPEPAELEDWQRQVAPALPADGTAPRARRPLFRC